MDVKEILKHVDHTLLKQTATWEDIREICDDGIKYGCASVCIPQTDSAQQRRKRRFCQNRSDARRPAARKIHRRNVFG